MIERSEMIPGWQPIRNVSSSPQPLKDALLPNGAIVVQPGETVSIPRDVYRRHMYRCQLWMANADVVPAPEAPVEEVASEEPSKERVAKATRRRKSE